MENALYKCRSFYCCKKIATEVKTLKDDVVIMITPPFTALSKVSECIKGSNILLGAQNMSYMESGARTSEISPSMLLEFGVEYVILGHSECRLYLAETDEIINKKILAGLKHPFKYLILCVGETLDERDSGKTLEVVLNQVKKGLNCVSESDIQRIILAYEPVWAIGTVKPQLKKRQKRFIRQLGLRLRSFIQSQLQTIL